MTVARLRQAAESVTDPDLCAWLGSAADAIEQGLAADLALELRGPAAIAQRNQLLHQAAQLSGIESPWAQAGWIARRIKQLGYRRQHEAIDRLLLAAAACAKIPESQRRIYDALVAHDERVPRPASVRDQSRVAAA